jgi:hypothetical protein
MILLRLFAAHVRARQQCFCGAPEIHKGCADLALESFLHALESYVRPKV